MHSCLELFEASSRDEGFADAIDTKHPHCGCETHQVSQHCTDPVGLEEVLVRLVVDPIHIIDDNGVRLRSTFLNQISTYGTSTLRLGRAAPEEYHETARLLLEENPTLIDGSKRQIYGVVKLPVKMLKDEQAELIVSKMEKLSFGAVCVYATGEENRPNHADILLNCGVTHNLKRAKKNRIAEKLAERVERAILSVEDFKEVVDLTRWQLSDIHDAGGLDDPVDKNPTAS